MRTRQVSIIFKDNSYPQIICIKSTKYNNLIFVCGLATSNVLNNYQDDDLILDPNLRARGTKTSFYGFEQLVPIKSILSIMTYLQIIKIFFFLEFFLLPADRVLAFFTWVVPLSQQAPVGVHLGSRTGFRFRKKRLCPPIWRPPFSGFCPIVTVRKSTLLFSVSRTCCSSS